MFILELYALNKLYILLLIKKPWEVVIPMAFTSSERYLVLLSIRYFRLDELSQLFQ